MGTLLQSRHSIVAFEMILRNKQKHTFSSWNHHVTSTWTMPLMWVCPNKKKTLEHTFLQMIATCWSGGWTIYWTRCCKPCKQRPLFVVILATLYHCPGPNLGLASLNKLRPHMLWTVNKSAVSDHLHRWLMYVCVHYFILPLHIYIYIHIDIYICVCVWSRVSSSRPPHGIHRGEGIHRHMRIHMHIHTVYICTCTYYIRIHTRVCMYIYIYIHTCFIYIYICIYVYYIRIYNLHIHIGTITISGGRGGQPNAGPYIYIPMFHLKSSPGS